MITLTGDTWTQGVGQLDETGNGASDQLIRGFTSMQSESFGWNAVVRAGMPQANVQRTTDTVVTITVQQFSSFDITAPETIEVVIPPVAVSSAQAVVAPSFVVLPIKGSATLSGRLIEQPAEASLCCGEGLQLTISLTDDTWVAGVGLDDGSSAVLFAGLTALQDEPGGWNAVLQPALLSAGAGSVQRVSDTQVVISLPPLAAYTISAPETILVAIPAAAITSAQRVVAQPALGFVVHATSSEVVLAGSLAPTAEEEALRSMAGNSLIIHLQGDTFVPAVLLPGEASAAMLASIRSDQNEPGGWNAVVQPALTYAALAWDGEAPSVLRLTLPQFYLYSITAPETVKVSIPAVAVASARASRKPVEAVVLATRGTVRVGGDLLDAASDAGLRESVTSTLELALEGDTWLPNLGQPNAATSVLLASIARHVPYALPPPPAALTRPDRESPTRPGRLPPRKKVEAPPVV